MNKPSTNRYRIDVGRESFYVEVAKEDFSCVLEIENDDECIPVVEIGNARLTFEDPIVVVLEGKTIFDSDREEERYVEAVGRWEDHPSLTASERNPGLARRWSYD